MDSVGARAGEAAANWTIAILDYIGRLRDDAVLIVTLWRLLRKCDSASPIKRVKLASSQALLAAMRAEGDALPPTLTSKGMPDGR